MYEPSCIPYLNVLLYFVWLGGKRIVPRPQLLHIMAASNPLSSASQIDWRKCCLCQTDIKEELKSPPTHYSCSPESNFSMIATNIPLFQAIHQLPIRLDMSRLDDGGGIEETLRRNSANTEKEQCNNAGEGYSKMRRTVLQVQKCFLCEMMEPMSELRQAMTMQLNDRVNECARNLNDGFLPQV